MEHASEALKLAFAVIVFTIAISLTMSIFGKAKNTADVVLSSSDKLEYYIENSYGISNFKSGNRIVGVETVIPTLYKYDKERYKIVFKKGNYDIDKDEITNIAPLDIYETNTDRKSWSKKYINDFDNKTTYNSAANQMKICSFDINEEIQRNEPWTGNRDEIKKHLDAIVLGDKYILPQDESLSIDYSSNPLLNKNSKFIEQVGEVITQKNGIKGNKTTKKRIITYILIK